MISFSEYLTELGLSSQDSLENVMKAIINDRNLGGELNRGHGISAYRSLAKRLTIQLKEARGINCRMATVQHQINLEKVKCQTSLSQQGQKLKESMELNRRLVGKLKESRLFAQRFQHTQDEAWSLAMEEAKKSSSMQKAKYLTIIRTQTDKQRKLLEKLEFSQKVLRNYMENVANRSKELDSERAKMLAQISCLRAAENDRKGLDQEIATLGTTNEKLDSTLNEVNNDLNSLRDENKRLSEDCDEKNAEIRKLRAECEQSKIKVHTLQDGSVQDKTELVEAEKLLKNLQERNKKLARSLRRWIIMAAAIKLFSQKFHSERQLLTENHERDKMLLLTKLQEQNEALLKLEGLRADMCAECETLFMEKRNLVIKIEDLKSRLKKCILRIQLGTQVIAHLIEDRESQVKDLSGKLLIVSAAEKHRRSVLEEGIEVERDVQKYSHLDASALFIDDGYNEKSMASMFIMGEFLDTLKRIETFTTTLCFRLEKSGKELQKSGVKVEDYRRNSGDNFTSIVELYESRLFDRISTQTAYIQMSREQERKAACAIIGEFQRKLAEREAELVQAMKFIVLKLGQDSLAGCHLDVQARREIRKSFNNELDWLQIIQASPMLSDPKSEVIAAECPRRGTFGRERRISRPSLPIFRKDSLPANAASVTFAEGPIEIFPNEEARRSSVLDMPRPMSSMGFPTTKTSRNRRASSIVLGTSTTNAEENSNGEENCCSWC